MIPAKRMKRRPNYYRICRHGLLRGLRSFFNSENPNKDRNEAADGQVEQEGEQTNGEVTKLEEPKEEGKNEGAQGVDVDCDFGGARRAMNQP
jgi:hypothetical protein